MRQITKRISLELLAGVLVLLPLRLLADECGVELAGRLQMTSRLPPEGNFACVDAKYDEFNENIGGASVSRAGNSPTNVPARVANAWLTYDIMADWQIGMDVRYVASVYADMLRAPSYTRYGAYVRCTLNNNTSFTGRARNLTDEFYAKQAYGTIYYAGAPRIYEFAVDARF
jgi:iron complex outermembrane receptor protein